MRLPILFSFLFISVITVAQDFTINKTDATAFPDISFTITSKNPIDKNIVSIVDNKKSVKDFQWILSVDEAAARPGAVFFLIEASSFVSDNQMAFVKRAIKTQLLSLNTSTLANAGFYVRSNSVEMLKRLSTEFTADFNSLSRDVESKIYISKDKQPVTDLYKVVYECLDFIGKKGSLPNNKKIILISTGNNNGTSAFTINECVAKAKETNIAITAVGLRSTTQNAMDNLKLLAEKTNGNFTFAKNEADINLFLKQDTFAKTYRVQYRSNATTSNDTVVSQLNVGEQVKEFYYVSGKSESTSFFGKNKVALLIAGSLVILILAGLVFYLRSKRKKMEAEVLRLKKQELTEREILRKKAEKETATKMNPVSPSLPAASTRAVINKPIDEVNINRTRIAGVKRAQIIVMQQGGHKFYELNNLSTKIGRNTDNDIIIADKTVSGFHAVISIENGKIFITDHSSTNGTFVNNHQIERSELQNNDMITLGKIEIRYNY